MSFNTNMLPHNVKKVYELGPLAWVYVVRTAINEGIRDVDFLADIAFYLHHPELNGRTINVGEINLIEEWKSFRSLIKPLMKKKKEEKYGNSKAHFALMAAPMI